MANDARKKYALVEDVLNKADKKSLHKEATQALKVFHELTQELDSLKTVSEIQNENTRYVDKLKEENRELKEKLDHVKRQAEEFRNRLSKIAGQKMTEGNPDIADLSDPFRPTNLAENFKQLYDDIWTPAYETLTKAEIEEHKVIAFLADITKNVDDMCVKTSESQISKLGHYITDDLVSPKLQTEKCTYVASTMSLVPMEDAQKERVYKLLKEFRKSFATYAAKPLVEIFEMCYTKEIEKTWKFSTDNADIKKFVSKCVEIIWLMKIQSPPMELLWQQEGDECDKERYTFYTKRSGKVAQCVWPAVLLHAGNGPLISKGVIQGQ